MADIWRDEPTTPGSSPEITHVVKRLNFSTLSRPALTPRKFVATPVKASRATKRPDADAKVAAQRIVKEISLHDGQLESGPARTFFQEPADHITTGVDLLETIKPDSDASSIQTLEKVESRAATEIFEEEVEDILDSPSPASPSFSSPTAPIAPRETGPLVSGNESEDEWRPTKTPGTGRKKRVVLDSDDEVSPGPSRRAAAQFVDLTAAGSDAEEDEYEYDLAKHYDESYGSLKDFIVNDDSDEGSDGGSSGEGEFDHSDEDGGDDDDDGSLSDTSLPDLGTLSLNPPRTPKRPAPRPPASAKASGRDWPILRESLALDIFRELDRRVFGGELGEATLEWSKRLLTTAGTANLKHEKQKDGTRKQIARIMLSEKVLTGEKQILNTVAHEMCHLACWLISNERKNPHGRVFKSWGQKVMRARPDIEVTTTHKYEIEYKYQWKCTRESCAKIYRRHSKSIDVQKHACSRCGSKLVALFVTKAGNAFQLYLKANMASAKTSLPGASHGEVMRALSRQWQEAGPAADHEAFWRSMASAQRPA